MWSHSFRSSMCQCDHQPQYRCIEVVFLTRRPFGTEPEFFVQLFVEFDGSLKVPTIDTLLQKMFKEQQISFAGVSLLLT